MSIYRYNNYSRAKAVNYAKQYALSSNQAYKYFPVVKNTGGDCTNFVSQCLNYGGASMSYTPTNPWWYNGSSHSWTMSWAVAHSLYWYLKRNYKNKTTGIKGMEIKDLNLLELGDLIFYRNYKGIVVHAAIITAFNSNEPLVSQHSYDALNIPYKSTHENHRIHLLKIIL